MYYVYTYSMDTLGVTVRTILMSFNEYLNKLEHKFSGCILMHKKT